MLPTQVGQKEQLVDTEPIALVLASFGEAVQSQLIEIRWLFWDHIFLMEILPQQRREVRPQGGTARPSYWTISEDM